MTPESVVLELLELFHSPDIAGQLPRISTYLSDDVSYQPLVPLAATRVGRAAVLAELADQATRFRDCRCNVSTIAVAQGRVFLERTDTVTMHAGEHQVIVQVAAVFELDDDLRVTSWREYWDTADVARQLGISAEAMPLVAAARSDERFLS